MKIALLQINPVVGNLEGNSDKIKAFAIKAKSQNADLCITSELALIGYPPRDLLLYPSFILQTNKSLQNLARVSKNLPPILVGTATLNKNKRGRPLFNSAVLIKDGKIEQVFHKSLLPTYDVFDEDRYFEPINKAQVLKIQDNKIGISICEDLWNDADFWQKSRYHHDPINQLANENVDLIINLSASPFTIDKQKIREKMISQSAKKYEVPFVYVNQVGGNDDLIFDGASLVFNKKGNLVTKAKSFREDLITIDTNNLSRPLKSQTSPKDELLIFEALALGVRDYVSKCGFKKAFIGLSGGIDSSVTAVITAKALGPENVTAVLMPSPYTSKASIQDALKLSKNLGIKTITITIDKIIDEFKKTLKPVFKNLPKDTTEQNIQSRIRGSLLMALANKYHSLVLATGNKSELTVGYSTLYGDTAGALAPIGDLYKTQVYKLVNWINRQKEVVPKNIIKRPPSAELKPNQKDQDDLPPYEVLDKIIRLYIEEQQNASQISSRGFNKTLVKEVLTMVKRAEFKRRQNPPALKVTSRAYGSGWRMPIAAASKVL